MYLTLLLIISNMTFGNSDKLPFNLKWPDQVQFTEPKSVVIENRKSLIYKYNTKSTKAEIEIQSPAQLDEFNTLSKNKSLVILGLYDKRPSPYFGLISKSISCPKELMPQIYEQKNVKYLIASTDNQFRFGICSKEKLTSMTVIGWFLKDTQLVEFKLSVPKNNKSEVDNLVKSIKEIVN